MINMYVKKQVKVQKVADRRTNGQTNRPIGSAKILAET